MSQPEDSTPVPLPQQPTLPIDAPAAHNVAAEPLAFPLAGFPGRPVVDDPGPGPRPPVPPPAARPPAPVARPAYPARPGPRVEFVDPLDAFDQPARRRSPLLLPAVVAVALVAVGVLGWVLWPSSSTPAAGEDSGPGAPPSASAEDAARLDGLLPAGYPAGACSPVDVPSGALAKVRCARNTETDGPDSATYTLAADIDSLGTLFDAVTKGGAIVVCPGNIQSPVHCPTGRVEGVRGVASVMMRPMPVK